MPKFSRPLCFAVLLILLTGCAATPLPATPTITVQPATVIPSATFTPPATAAPLPTSTRTPLKLLFYGDSVLKVGDVSRESQVGYSFVDALRPRLDPSDTVILQNHGGRTAQWALENLQVNVLDQHPDLVTLWWGMNDLHGCPGIFDDSSRYPIQYKLTAYINQYIQAMQAQIEALLAINAKVIVMTALPIDGTLPWSHFTPDGQLVWENDHRCNINLGLEQLVAAQRQLVADEAAQGKPVYLVDVWQVYQDHLGQDKIYMDIVHPGSQGAELIADAWLEVYRTFER